MKKIFAVVLLGLLCCGTAVLRAAEPEQFIPATAPAIVRINVGDLLAKPWMKNVLAKAEANEKFAQEAAELQKAFGVPWHKLIVGNAWITMPDGNFDQKNGSVFLFKTPVAEAKLAQSLNAAQTDKKFVLSKKVLAGKTFYISTPVRRNQQKTAEASALAYLAEDVVLLCKAAVLSDEFVQQFNGKSANALLKQIDRSAVAAMLIDVAAAAGNDQCSQVKGVLKLAGDKVENLSFELDLHGVFKDKNAASQLAMQIQLMFPGLVGLVFGNDDKLAMELAGALKVKTEKEEMFVSYRISYNTLLRIEKYLANPANRPASGRNQSVGKPVELNNGAK